MSRKFHTYEYLINELFNNNFIIHNIKDRYYYDDILDVTCKVCGIKHTKRTNYRINGECRNCEMKKLKSSEMEEKFKKIEGVISWEKEKSGYSILFKCSGCNLEKRKKYQSFKKSKLCKQCFCKKIAANRDKTELYNKFLATLKDNNIEYILENEYFSMKDLYDNIKYKCSSCNTYNSDKFYTVKRACGENKEYLCTKCSKDNKRKKSTYNLVKFYKNNPELSDKIGYLYFYDIKISDKIYTKIGITRNDVLSRTINTSKLYEVSNIRYIEDTNLNVSILERELKNKYKNFKILPDVKFSGYTECFTVPIDIEENMKVQRLSHNVSTTQVNGVGSG